MPATDDFEGLALGLQSPLTHAVQVTPSDTEDLPRLSRAIYIAATGNLEVTMAGGETLVLAGLIPGWHSIRVSRIHAAGTTATDIVAAW